MKRLIMSVAIVMMASLTISAQETNSVLKSVMEPYVSSGQIGGIVEIVAKGDKVLDITEAGYSDVAKKLKMDEHSLFWIASQGKMIAASAVMMLVEEGKLNLDEPITTYLPELKRLVVARVWREGWQVEEKLNKPITLRNLLSHTSGMQWITAMHQQAGKIDILPLKLSLYATALTPLGFEPGEKYSYSNQGVNVAATIVERVSGMKYEDFLKKRLFDPLDMRSATFYPTVKEQENLAKAYKIGTDGKLKEIPIDQLQYPLEDRTKRYAEAAGGLFCSPIDLVKFYQMLANRGTYKGVRYLSEKSVEEISKKQTPSNVAEQYGLCCTVNDEWFGHGGAYGTDTRVYRKSGYVVMYFIQENGLPKAGEVHNKFFEAVEKEYPVK